MITISPSASKILEGISDLRKETEVLSSKERVRIAISHQEPDRVPIDLWVTNEVKKDLETYFGYDYNTLLDMLGVDFRVIHGPSYVGLELEKHPDGTVSDLWGVRRCTVPYGQGDRKGTYKELAYSPLEKMKTVQEIESYPGWPSADWWDYSEVAEDCQKFPGKCVVFAGDRLDRTAQLKTAMYLRGIEQIMVDLAVNPAIVECILEHVTAYYLDYNNRVFDAAQGEIDIFMMGDDFGMQTGMFMRMESWERYFESGFRKFIKLAHDHGVVVMHHTCGSVVPLIPKFIEAGLDILQSLQPRAVGMDLASLKQKFGEALAFHGSVDIQKTMPFGAKEEIRAEVKERMHVGKPGGGFIICTAHNIQRDVPIENIIALISAYHEFGGYSKLF
jgi:uroporphyrinogen decarboxylase